MWLPLVLSILLLGVIGLVVWSTWELFSQNLAKSIGFWLFAAVAVVPPVAWAVAAV